MALTAQQTQGLARIERRIAINENIMAVSGGLGASHSAQGVSNSFSDTQIRMAASLLPMLYRVKEQYDAIAAGEQIPAAPGRNLSNYIQE